MKSTNTLILSLLISITPLCSVNAQQEDISTSGIGIAETKFKACEIALDYARKEAAQSATTVVSSNFKNFETNKGISSTTDQTITSKAFAKLINKTEKASFDEKTGQIFCEVTADFLAGFINKDISNDSSKSYLNNQTNLTINEFKAGKPFCSKIMDRCFREIYSKQLKEFGIQILPTKQQRDSFKPTTSDENRFNIFFNKAKINKNDKNSIDIKTRESLIELIKQEHAKICDRCPLTLYINQYRWNKEKGFVHINGSYPNPKYTFYYNTDPIKKKSIFSKLEPPSEYLKQLDKEMKETQTALDNLF